MKIVQVLNTIISNKDKISNVLRQDKEYFFVYDSIYKWSIIKSDKLDDYIVIFYPTDQMKIEELASHQDWQSFTQYISFSSEDLKSKEALETFRELYQIVVSKIYGLDKIFDDIINGDN